MASGKPCSSTSGNLASPTRNELTTCYSLQSTAAHNREHPVFPLQNFRSDGSEAFAFLTWIYEADRSKIGARQVCPYEARESFERYVPRAGRRVVQNSHGGN